MVMMPALKAITLILYWITALAPSPRQPHQTNALWVTSLITPFWRLVKWKTNAKNLWWLQPTMAWCMCSNHKTAQPILTIWNSIMRPPKWSAAATMAAIMWASIIKTPRVKNTVTTAKPILTAICSMAEWWPAVPMPMVKVSKSSLLPIWVKRAEAHSPSTSVA